MSKRKLVAMNVTDIPAKKPRLEGNNSEIHLQFLGGQNSDIAVISLNRPEVKNALNQRMVQTLLQTVTDLHHRPGLRVVILRSHTKGIFCAGADLKERQSMSPDEVLVFLHTLRAAVRALEELPVPVLAALDGSALGGGLELALGCDLRVGAGGAWLGLPEVRLGVIPGAGGTQRLGRLVGSARARDMVLTARCLGAEEAHTWGLLNYCVEQEEGGEAAYQRALLLAKDLLGSAPLALAMAKVALREGEGQELEDGLEVEAVCYHALLGTRDREEGLRAFREKRTPLFVGE